MARNSHMRFANSDMDAKRKARLPHQIVMCCPVHIFANGGEGQRHGNCGEGGRGRGRSAVGLQLAQSPAPAQLLDGTFADLTDALASESQLVAYLFVAAGCANNPHPAEPIRRLPSLSSIRHSTRGCKPSGKE